MLGYSNDEATTTKRPLLPSELKKKLLKSKKAKSTTLLPTSEQLVSCFRTPLMSTTQSSGRKPFSLISPNTLPCPIVESNQTFLPSNEPKGETPKASWSLLKQLTLSTNSKVSEWKLHYGKADLDDSTPKFTDLEKIKSQLEYYRFPFPELSKDAKTKLSKMIKSKLADNNGIEQEHFKKMIDCWRRALLSLYQTLKNGKISYFYYLQSSDLVVLFRTSKTLDPTNDNNKQGKREINAVIACATSSLVTLLCEEGVPFEQLTEQVVVVTDQTENGTETTNNNDLDKENLHPAELEGLSDQENSMDPKAIKQVINRVLSKARRTNSKRRSVAASTLLVKGEAAVHMLVDFIMNQRDGKSYIIIPELIAPGPFLHGTLCRTELAIVGPILGGEFQVKVHGTVLPSAANELISQVYELSAGSPPFSITTSVDERTESFLSLPLPLPLHL